MWLLKFKSLLCFVQGVRHWASCLTPLSFTFLICKMELVRLIWVLSITIHINHIWWYLPYSRHSICVCYCDEPDPSPQCLNFHHRYIQQMGQECLNSAWIPSGAGNLLLTLSTWSVGKANCWVEIYMLTSSTQGSSICHLGLLRRNVISPLQDSPSNFGR